MVPLRDGIRYDRELCVLPVCERGESIPQCMEMLGVDEAIAAIASKMRTVSFDP